jgi:hypothetical protein
MIEFFLGLAFWPSIILILLFISLVSSAYQESVQFAAVCSVIAGLIAWFAYDVNVFRWVFDNPGVFFGGTLLYLSIGAFWSVLKWQLRLSTPEAKAKLREAKNHYITTMKPGDDPDGWLNSYALPGYLKPQSNKDRITSWIVLWPFSLLLYFTGEFVTQVIGRIYEQLTGIYNRMTINAAGKD